MAESPPEAQEPSSLREAIERFIQEVKLGPKLEKIDKEIQKMVQEGKTDEVEKLRAKRESEVLNAKREDWIAGAASRASQIEIVSHGIKFTHSAAKGTSLLFERSCPERKNWIGTHTAVRDRENDIVGNAAALDVNKFLRIEFKGKTLFQHVAEGSDELLRAMGDDLEQSASWLKQFASVTGLSKVPASHTLTKQLFFPLEDGNYHLLGPLFATSLQQSTYTRIQEKLFGERAKIARMAKKCDGANEHGFEDFPDLAIQAFGGSNPQNISQLNSQRRGAWLLPSCPPTWRSPAVRAPLGVPTVFGRVFGGRRAVRELTRALADFLARIDYNNVHIRRTRAAMVEQLVDELSQFAAELQELEPGWSQDSACKLDPSEALWLDPGRAASDEIFAAARQQGDWQDSVAGRFGNWLNAQLRYLSKKQGELKLGEAEQFAWKAEVEDALKLLRTELDHE